jgi:hypothetical protein
VTGKSYVCLANVAWVAQVEGSSGNLYFVTWGATARGESVYGWTCTCLGFTKTVPGTVFCKHIKSMEAKRCAWTGEKPERAPSGDPLCPKCGGPAVLLPVPK